MLPMDSALLDLADRIQAATANATPLRIRGSGSKDFYGQALQGEILDTRGLSGIVCYEPSELFVTVRAGTPLLLLEAELAAQGQALAFEPPHFGPGATVGAMVACGLAGPARAAAGGVRDHVLGVQMLNGNGELLCFGGQVMKNVAGYDVSRLMVGALGTLGLITQVSLKVLPRPLARATLRLEIDQAAALRQLNVWAAQALPINANCWVQDAGAGRLTVRLGGAVAAVQAALPAMGGERVDEATATPYWEAVREHTMPFFDRADGQCLWRLSVPDSCGVIGLHPGQGADLVEWGGALRWAKAPASAAQALREVVSKVGGTATLFRRAVADRERQGEAFHPLPAPVERIHRALKKQFDPAGIFNRARLYADF